MKDYKPQKRREGEDYFRHVEKRKKKGKKLAESSLQ